MDFLANMIYRLKKLSIFNLKGSLISKQLILKQNFTNMLQIPKNMDEHGFEKIIYWVVGDC